MVCPRGRWISQAIRNIDKKKDGFTTSNGDHKVKLKATSSEDRDQWIRCCHQITNKHFTLLYKYVLEDGDQGIASQGKDVPPKPQTPEPPSRITFGENIRGNNVFAEQQAKTSSRITFGENIQNRSVFMEDNTPKESHEEITQKFKNMTIVSKKRHLIVAAIDFGSAYSGCAFSLRKDFIKNPLDIFVMSIAESGVESLKEPTVLLLHPDGKFKAFGYEAEKQYAELLQDEPEKAKDYYYFSRFKMQLYNNKDLKKSMIITDISGQKNMKGVDVFSYCIEYIKEFVFERAKGQKVDIEEESVHWVLTVPAIWDEAARQFMIDAAEKAGIDPENLTLALEPEAAALCCKCLEIQKQDQGQVASLRSFDTGSKFLVIDLGGGTVDITSNEVLETGQLKEIYRASGGPWGGNTINVEFWKLLRGIFGSDIVKKFINNHRDEYLEMTKAIEIKKRQATTHDTLTLEIPYYLLKLIKKSNTEIVSGKYRDTVKVRGNKITIEPGVVYKFFKSGIDAICNYVQELLNKPETAGVSTILLVGGYASCDLLKDAVKERFQNLTVIRPLNSDLLVLKGAVILGHMDTPIIGRIAKCHYGFAVGKEQTAFDRSFMPFTGMQEFIPFIIKGQPIKVNDIVSEYDVPIAVDQQEAFVRIYASDDDKPPIQINDGNCRMIGHIKINLPRFRKNTILKIGISNDETEFKVVARDNHTGRCFSGVCRFLT